MQRNHLLKLLTLLTLGICVVSMSGCSNKDKETVLSSNVKSQVKSQSKQDEAQVNKILDSSKQADTKKVDEKVDGNTNEKAVDLVKAKPNNQNVQTQVKKVYSKPSTVNEVKRVDNNQTINPNANRVTNENDVQAQKVVGFVKNMYEKNGKRYLTIDDAEFYKGDAALQAAIKDNKKVYYDNNKPEIDDDYYIRDTDTTVKEYEISDSATFNAAKLVFNPYDDENLEPNHPASYDSIKNVVNANTSKYDSDGTSQDRRNLYWITIKNNVVTQMDWQYTP